jgi:DNA mismatch repair ATPase MutL
MDALFQSWTSPVWPLAPLREPSEAPRPASITAAHLRDAVLVGTVPGRYLIARSRGGDGAVLFAVDQHAADERCLLERLTWEHEARLRGGGSPPRARRQDAELFQLSPQLCAALQSHAALVRRAGWRWEEEADQQQGVLRLLAAPAEPLDPHARLGGEHLAEWLTELCGIPAGPAARLACPHPPVVSRLLASAACRHAIMFGDVLRWEEAEALLHALGGTQMPLSCAHGRPTAAPLALLPSEREGGGEAGGREARSLGRARALLAL